MLGPEESSRPTTFGTVDRGECFSGDLPGAAFGEGGGGGALKPEDAGGALGFLSMRFDVLEVEGKGKRAERV